MKDIVTTINESRTNLLGIEGYTKTWVTEYEPQMFNQILTSIFKGLKRGLEENAKCYKEEKDKQEIKNGLTVLVNLDQTRKEFLL